MTDARVFLGVDIGTQGVRVAAVDGAGTLVAAARHSFVGPPRTEEQSPDVWWAGVVAQLRSVAGALGDRIPIALAVTSTSGTVVPLDRAWHPIHDALMYGDRRSGVECDEIATMAPGLGVNPSWGLPKMLWFMRNHSATAERIWGWRHAADFVVGRLTGDWDTTDETNALKSGYDPATKQWPTGLLGALDIDADQLPRVLPSGTIVGRLSPSVAADTGLSESVIVTLGMTDGCASQVAAGAVDPGDWNATIGTTLVVKGVTRQPVVDPRGRIYNHRHPEGFWLPGAASNTGADWISRDYPSQSAQELDRTAGRSVPTGGTAYPLRQTGERFPFVAPNARGFEAAGLEEPARLAAKMEGVAYLERMAFELLERLSGERAGRIFVAGGASQGTTWLRIRSNVLGRPLSRARHADAAVGAAIVAASTTHFDGLRDAAGAMVHTDLVVEPDGLTRAYDEGYRMFLEELTRRGYWSPEAA